MFHHGWPLSSDDWDTQMLFFLQQGLPRHRPRPPRPRPLRARSSDGHDMDHYAADARRVVEHLDLRNAIHIGHSTGGGEVARYVARYGQPQGRVAKAVLVSAVPPMMVKTDEQSRRHADRGVRRLPRGARRQPRPVLPRRRLGPVLRLQPAGRATSRRASIDNWWRQGMMGSAKAHYDCIKAFSETDFRPRT